jgi:hypothetical protein
MELRNVVGLPLWENTTSSGMTPVVNNDGNTTDRENDKLVKGLTETI